MIKSILFLPHGMQIIPEVEENQSEKFKQINDAMHKLLVEFSSNNPITDVLLITPHGYNLDSKLTLYNHNNFTGKLFKLSPESNIIGEELMTLNFHGNIELMDELKNLLPKSDFEVLCHGFPEYPLTLNWGEIVPLYYYDKYSPLSKYSIVCYPRARHTDLHHIKALNTKLVSALDKIENDIILIISGDLSHVHNDKGPYGYHESSKEFDKLVKNWSETFSEKSMERLKELQPVALACGMAGLMLIHELLTTENYSFEFGFYEVPTYFGMGSYWWKLKIGEY